MMIILLEMLPLSQLLCSHSTKLMQISFEEEEFDHRCPCLFGSSVYLLLELLALSEQLALLLNYFWFLNHFS